MAKVNGFGTGFDAATFRTAIKNTMKMGSPNTVEQKATFRWKTFRAFSGSDSSGKPWVKDAVPVYEVSYPDVQIDCAVEFITRSTLSGGTAVGDFDTPRAIITVLDVDYVKIAQTSETDGADLVLLGGATYKIDFVAPPIALFDVDVYQIHCSAVDEV